MNCPECDGQGYILYRNKKGYLIARECRCMDRRRSLLRLARSGLSDMARRCTFENFRAEEPWQQEARQAAERYAADPMGWFLAAGSSGSGKTHLCTAICKALIDAGIETHYLLWRDMSAKAKSVVGKDPAAYSAIVEPLKTVPALYIDDLFKTGKEMDRATGQWRRMVPTSGDLSLAFEILNARYCDSSRLTLLSTELSLPELMDVDEALGSRIFERCREGGLLRLENRANWRLGAHRPG